MQNLKLKMQNCNSKYRSFFNVVFLLVYVAIPSFVFAEGLVPCDGVSCDFNSLVLLVQNIIDLAIKIAPMLAAVAFAVAGFYYITAAGDTGKIKQAHDIAITTVYGLVLALVAWILIKTIIIVLGGKEGFILLNF